ncbi:hypothetical protein HPB49_013022 [Dermacentor silvarum]|uniref:Uncharacterized protein n=1 Tax=Dermacentor silvarum TaxID=543639 RepID=A0ACB8E0C0_DERSI|nr:hypothetical protein HPB49_013022 [Dermacentor silvarum]
MIPCRVPNFVPYGSVLLQCTLYHRQIDICYACGCLGHRADVCRNPGDVISRGCGAPHSRSPEHQCTPKCKLCGGAHLTADKACKERYHIPYVVGRRRWERARLMRDDDDCATALNAAADDGGRSVGNPSTSRSGDRSGSCSRRGSRSRSRHRACSRGAPRGPPTGSASRSPSGSRPGSRSGSLSGPRPGTSGAPRQRSASPPAPSSAGNANKNRRGTLTGVDIVRGRGNATSQVGSGSLPEHVTHTTSEIAFLKRENAMMKEMIHKLTATIAELKNDRGVRDATPATDNTANADTPSPLEPIGAANDDGESAPKKGAVIREHPALKPELDDIKSVLSSIKTSLRFLRESMALVQSTLAAHGDRLGKVEHYLDHVVAPAVAAAKPVSQGMPTPSPPPHVALLHPSDARTNPHMLQDGQAK